MIYVMSNYAIMRAQKLTRGALTKSIKHLAHHNESAEISHPELTQRNYLQFAKVFTDEGGNFSKKAYKSHIDKIIKKHNENPITKRALRSNASIATEFVLSFSPDALTDMTKKQKKAFIADFEKSAIAFLKSEFPTMQPIVAAAHHDEESYHLHVIALCFENEQRNRISARACLGGPAEMRQHQTNFAEQVAHLGLERGIPKKDTKKIHKSKYEWLRSEIEQKQAQKDMLKTDVANLEQKVTKLQQDIEAFEREHPQSLEQIENMDVFRESIIGPDSR